MKFTILEDLSLVIITMYSVFLIYAQKVRRRSLKKYMFLIQNFLPLGWGRGGMKFTISRLLTLQMLQTKFGKVGPVQCSS